MAWTGQHPGWKILPVRMGYYSDTNWARRFWCEGHNTSLMHVGATVSLRKEDGSLSKWLIPTARSCLKYSMDGMPGLGSILSTY